MWLRSYEQMKTNKNTWAYSLLYTWISFTKMEIILPVIFAFKQKTPYKKTLSEKINLSNYQSGVNKNIWVV